MLFFGISCLCSSSPAATMLQTGLPRRSMLPLAPQDEVSVLLDKQIGNFDAGNHYPPVTKALLEKHAI